MIVSDIIQTVNAIMVIVRSIKQAKSDMHENEKDYVSLCTRIILYENLMENIQRDFNARNLEAKLDRNDEMLRAQLKQFEETLVEAQNLISDFRGYTVYAKWWKREECRSRMSKIDFQITKNSDDLIKASQKLRDDTLLKTIIESNEHRRAQDIEDFKAATEHLICSLIEEMGNKEKASSEHDEYDTKVSQIKNEINDQKNIINSMLVARKLAPLTDSEVYEINERMNELSDDINPKINDLMNTCNDIAKEVHQIFEMLDKPDSTRRKEIIKRLTKDTNQFQVCSNLPSLGNGGSSTVFKGYLTSDPDNLLAIKIIKCNKKYNIEVFEKYCIKVENELILLQIAVDNRFVVGAYGYCRDRENLKAHLILEYAPFGSVQDVLDRTENLDRDDSIPASLSLSWIVDMCKAVEHLHSLGIIHKDIKPGNLLVFENMKVKIGDLGLSKSDTWNILSTRGGGTEIFMAPEQDKSLNNMSSKASDVYSLGITAIVIILTLSEKDYKSAIYDNEDGFLAPKRLPETLEDKVVPLMIKVGRDEIYDFKSVVNQFGNTLQTDPKDRPSCAYIKSQFSEWLNRFQGGDPRSKESHDDYIKVQTLKQLLIRNDHKKVISENQDMYVKTASSTLTSLETSHTDEIEMLENLTSEDIILVLCTCIRGLDETDLPATVREDDITGDDVRKRPNFPKDLGVALSSAMMQEVTSIVEKLRTYGVSLRHLHDLRYKYKMNNIINMLEGVGPDSVQEFASVMIYIGDSEGLAEPYDYRGLSNAVLHAIIRVCTNSHRAVELKHNGITDEFIRLVEQIGKGSQRAFKVANIELLCEAFMSLALIDETVDALVKGSKGTLVTGGVCPGLINLTKTMLTRKSSNGASLAALVHCLEILASSYDRRKVLFKYNACKVAIDIVKSNYFKVDPCLHLPTVSLISFLSIDNLSNQIDFGQMETGVCYELVSLLDRSLLGNESQTATSTVNPLTRNCLKAISGLCAHSPNRQNIPLEMITKSIQSVNTIYFKDKELTDEVVTLMIEYLKVVRRISMQYPDCQQLFREKKMCNDIGKLFRVSHWSTKSQNAVILKETAVAAIYSAVIGLCTTNTANQDYFGKSLVSEIEYSMADPVLSGRYSENPNAEHNGESLARLSVALDAMSAKIARVQCTYECIGALCDKNAKNSKLFLQYKSGFEKQIEYICSGSRNEAGVPLNIQKLSASICYAMIMISVEDSSFLKEFPMEWLFLLFMQLDRSNDTAMMYGAHLMSLLNVSPIKNNEKRGTTDQKSGGDTERLDELYQYGVTFDEVYNALRGLEADKYKKAFPFAQKTIKAYDRAMSRQKRDDFIKVVRGFAEDVVDALAGIWNFVTSVDAAKSFGTVKRNKWKFITGAVVLIVVVVASSVYLTQKSSESSNSSGSSNTSPSGTTIYTSFNTAHTLNNINTATFSANQGVFVNTVDSTLGGATTVTVLSTIGTTSRYLRRILATTSVTVLYKIGLYDSTGTGTSRYQSLLSSAVYSGAFDSNLRSRSSVFASVVSQGISYGVVQVTNYPTVFPSNSPSFAPTNGVVQVINYPTTSPSNSPSFTSNNGVVQVTNYPTTSPSNGVVQVTNYPTKSPSNSPSFAPTNYPTKSPSNSPSFAPSLSPTSSPYLFSGLLGLAVDGFFLPSADIRFFDTAEVFDNFYTTDFGSLPYDYYSIMWSGYFYTQSYSGVFKFQLYADDLAYMWIGNTAASGYTFSNYFLSCAYTQSAQIATVTLSAYSYYSIRIAYGQGGGALTLSFSFTPPGSYARSSGVGFLFTDQPLRRISYQNSLNFYVMSGYFGNDVNYIRSYNPNVSPTTPDFLYGGYSSNLNDISSATNFKMPVTGYPNLFSIQWTGYFCPLISGVHTFTMDSDDASYFWIGSTATYGYTSNNAFLSSTFTTPPQQVRISLVAGQYYSMRIMYGQAYGAYKFSFSFTDPNGMKVTDGSNYYFRGSNGGGLIINVASGSNSNSNVNYFDDNSRKIFSFSSSDTLYQAYDFANINTALNGLTPTPNWQFFSVLWTGYFYTLGYSGTYTFTLDSDDKSYLWIGNTAASGYTTNNALVSCNYQPQSGSIYLAAYSKYPIRMMYSQIDGPFRFTMYFTLPGSSNIITNAYDYLAAA